MLHFYKPYNAVLLLVLLLGTITACNVAKDKTDTTNNTQAATGNEIKVAGTQPANQVEYEDFKNMSLEERWRSFSPERRNYLRQNPDIYPYYQPFIAAEPNMEPEGTIVHTNQQLPAIDTESPETPKTPEEWWKTFSEDRKAYMRQHPEYYPDFVPFFDK
ncbi:hypothetical protein C7N43_15250 [Sphingobacteriales bacterium UPWRP_1]|nr:hypothetical protein BVG80_08260 [Sphingobacteriales bacterium TSM_CSM]PSJ76133.1 hypothetical protein C7N43_15250 [Sphingobacteriales bacterium UPWRP_1]